MLWDWLLNENIGWNPRYCLVRMSKGMVLEIPLNLFYCLYLYIVYTSYLTRRIYIYKVVISVCLSVWMFDHNSGTPWQICIKCWLGNSGGPRECSYFGFFWESKLGGSALIAKILFPGKIDQVRVNGGSNYE